jgi:hypothetical protein
MPKNNIILLTMASSPANNARRLEETHEVVLKVDPLLDREVGFHCKRLGLHYSCAKRRDKDCRGISN